MIEHVAHGERIVERRIARATVLFATVATVGSVAGAVIADRVLGEPGRTIAGVAMALATVAALAAVLAGARVRLPSARPGAVAALVVWLAVVGAAAVAVEPVREWRWTVLVSALTLPNWVTAVRAARQADGS